MNLVVPNHVKWEGLVIFPSKVHTDGNSSSKSVDKEVGFQLSTNGGETVKEKRVLVYIPRIRRTLNLGDNEMLLRVLRWVKGQGKALKMSRFLEIGCMIKVYMLVLLGRNWNCWFG